MASLAGLEIEEVKRSWSQEFEADALGLSLMLAAMQKKGMDLSLSFWGADFFFSCIDILERGASVIRTGDENERHQSSHPDPQSRRENLRALISKQLPEQESKGPIELARTLEHIIEELWKRTKSTLRKHHDSGQRLSAIWR
jgi:predicted Zn-dependent protease